MSNGVVRDDVLDPFLIKMGLMGNPEHVQPTQLNLPRGQQHTTAAALGISEDILNIFGDIKELIQKGITKSFKNGTFVV